MLLLPNGCSCSNPSVFPKNWNATGASIKIDWRIQYYFYDPKLADKYPKGSLRIIKGMNSFRTLAERREAVKVLLEELMEALQLEGYNPITKKKVEPIVTDYEIDPSTKFIEALNQVLPKLDVVESTRSNLKGVIKDVKSAAENMRLDRLPISEIRRKHIKSILEHISKTKKDFSAHRFNKHRSYLMMLFKELEELEATDIDPVSKISKKKTETRLRELLTDKERLLIDKHLKKKTYTFWRFLQIFFHSGARETELLRLQAKDINLEKQRFKILIKKGKNNKWTERTIKDVALPLWEELLQGANPEDYIFSAGLKPGVNSIRADQIPRRWRTHVKESVKKGGLGITADFYSLKHLNLDETAATLDINAAAAMAGHTTPIITLKHYTQGEGDRQHERLRKVANSFAG